MQISFLSDFIIFIAFTCMLNFQGKGLGSGHKTLLYGNAILLRHSNSDMVTKSIQSIEYRLI